MVKYSLVSKNVINSQTTVLIEKKPLIAIDKFIFNNFRNEDEIRDYYKLTNDEIIKIAYKNRKAVKYIALIYKDNTNYFLKSIMNATDGSSIDVRNDKYLIFITNFIDSIDMEKVEDLFNRQYINLKVYNELMAYLTTPYNEYDYFYNFLKYHLSNYLSFRKLFVGLNHYKNKGLNNFDDEKSLISTGDELLNKLYNNGGLDAVYGVYDLDDIITIEGAEQLNVDSFSKKIGKK